MEQKCMLCPRSCGVDRNAGISGYCGMTNQIMVARAALHKWEEPCISGEAGSGTVFFSGCPLKCVFCQNRKIALGKNGKMISQERLTEIFLELQEKGANNINLVTPTHYAAQIVKSLTEAKNQGLKISIVYNTGSYENVDTLRMLEGLIDVYLPDFKYMSSEVSRRYSNAPDYAIVADRAIEEMLRQVGEPVFENDLIKRGVIVRHMILPGHTKDSKEILKHLVEKYKNRIYISIMNQYTPMADMQGFDEIKRKVTKREYEKVLDYALEIGLENGFIQEGETAKESFIPDFDSYVGLL